MTTELLQVQMSIEELHYNLEHDPEFFIQFFLGDELDLPVPEFHIKIFGLMVGQLVDRAVFAIPRDHAKTTLAKLAAVYYYIFTDFKFTIYLSETLAIAVPATHDILNFLDSENFRIVFGPVSWHIRQEGAGIYKFTIHFKDRDKLCMLRALGANQQVRGMNIEHQRPQLAIIDDVEGNDNIATEELFMKLKRWFYGPFYKCLDKRNNKIIQLGNMVASRCLLAEHCKSERWFSRLYGCLLSNGRPLWEDAFPLEKLIADFQEYMSVGMLDTWFAEMMNLPMAFSSGLIRPDLIPYSAPVGPGDIEYGFITVDPAISKQAWAHHCAVVVHGWVDGHWQSVEYEFEIGIDPIQLFDIIVDLAFKWKVHVIGIEAIAYQKALLPVFDYLAAERGWRHLEFVELQGANTQKVQRLVAWCALLKSKNYHLTDDDITTTTQLLQYDPKKAENEDDLIDAHAYAVQMIEHYLIEIMEEVEGEFWIENTPTSMYQISAI